MSVTTATATEPRTTKAPPVLDIPLAQITTFDDPRPTGTGINAAKMMAILFLPIRNEGQAIACHAALVISNDVRAKLGLPPLKQLKPGYQSDPMHCVIAETILDGYDGSKGPVSVSGSYVQVGTTRYRHSEGSSTFIGEFDHGNLSDLVKAE